VFLRQPRLIATEIPFDGGNHTFAIPEDPVPMNATEVQLLSAALNVAVYSASTIAMENQMLIRVSTIKQGRVYASYQAIYPLYQSAVSYDSMINWYPIGVIGAERNVTVRADSRVKPKLTEAFANVFVTAYRV
jgi:hypothetical protein